jgi:hypothetical protein
VKMEMLHHGPIRPISLRGKFWKVTRLTSSSCPGRDAASLYSAMVYCNLTLQRSKAEPIACLKDVVVPEKCLHLCLIYERRCDSVNGCFLNRRLVYLIRQKVPPLPKPAMWLFYGRLLHYCIFSYSQIWPISHILN